MYSRQPLAQVRPQALHVGGPSPTQYATRRVSPGVSSRTSTAACAHPRVLPQPRLDLAQLDAVAPHLDLEVDAPQELQLAVRQPPRPVARAVEARPRLGRERVRDELLRREPRPPQVPARHPDAADVQLAGHPHRHRLHPRVQHVVREVLDGLADGDAPLGVPVAGDLVQRAADDRLRGAVLVQQPHPRRVLAPEQRGLRQQVVARRSPASPRARAASPGASTWFSSDRCVGVILIIAYPGARRSALRQRLHPRPFRQQLHRLPREQRDEVGQRQVHRHGREHRRAPAPGRQVRLARPGEVVDGARRGA